MPALKNAKHEKFAHFVAKGKSSEQAYISAGYSERGARQAAARLRQNVDIESRIEEISNNIATIAQENSGISEARVIEELAHAAFFDINSIMNDKGELLPVHQMPETARRAIAAIDVQTVNVGRGEDAEAITTKKIRFVDKKGTLELIGKTMKMFTDKVEHSGSIDLSNKSDDELRAIIAGGEKKA